MKRYLLKKASADDSELSIMREDAPTPQPGFGEVLVKIHACSLNYRDLLMQAGKSASGGEGAIVPLSDGAGEIVEVGEDVAQWKTGDRVALTFFEGWESGPFEMKYHKAARGGSSDGVLSEFVIAKENDLVTVPDCLNYAEAATLPCAAVTAWQGLMERRHKPIGKGDTVLCLGTGGVSIFALQIAKAAGAKVIITSSSREKLERAAGLGADETISYKETPDWEKEVYSLTERKGVDHVIEVGGPGTLEKSMNAVTAGGTISLIGVLTGFDPPDTSLFPLVARAVDLHGIYVGSREMFQRMNQYLSKHQIHPVIDKNFTFDQAEEAYDFLKAGSHFGKIVIEMDEAKEG